MKITNFIITYIDNRLFLISLFLLFSMFMLLIAYERLNKLIFFILFGLISVFLCNTKNIASKISQKQLTILIKRLLKIKRELSMTLSMEMLLLDTIMI